MSILLFVSDNDLSIQLLEFIKKNISKLKIKVEYDPSVEIPYIENMNLSYSEIFIHLNNLIKPKPIKKLNIHDNIMTHMKNKTDDDDDNDTKQLKKDLENADFGNRKIQNNQINQNNQNNQNHNEPDNRIKTKNKPREKNLDIHDTMKDLMGGDGDD